MIKNNITPPFSQSNSALTVTLDNVLEALQSWRKDKITINERIPATIWEQIFILLETMPESTIRRATGISSAQFRQAQDEHKRQTGTIATQPKAIKNQEQIDFCETTPPEDSPLVYKPAKAFTTATSVVELYRPDGMLMKIHICTARFEELLRAFFTV